MKKKLKTIFLVLSILTLLLTAFVWFSLQPPKPLQSYISEFSLEGVTIINPKKNRSERVSLHVSKGVIKEIVSQSKLQAGSVTSYKGMFVLPGLIDMHTHLPPDNALKIQGHAALLYLAHGVTTIREAGDLDGTAVSGFRRAIRNRTFPTPRFFACGPFVGGPPAKWANTILVQKDGDEEKAVKILKKRGFHCVKSYDHLTAKQIKALKVSSKKHGLAMLGHVPDELTYEKALVPNVQHLMGVAKHKPTAGQNHVDRLNWDSVDDNRMKEIIDATLKHGIINTPTLVSLQNALKYQNYQQAIQEKHIRLMPRLFPAVLWSPTQGLPQTRKLPNLTKTIRATLAKQKKLTHLLFKAGARLQIGSDTLQPLTVAGFSVHQEMQLFAEAGIPAEDIWAIATWKAGLALGIEKLGTIQKHAPADLLIFRKDPTKSLSALSTLQAVVSKGRLFTVHQLRNKLEDYNNHFQGRVFDGLSVPVTKMIISRAKKKH